MGCSILWSQLVPRNCAKRNFFNFFICLWTSSQHVRNILPYLLPYIHNHMILTLLSGLDNFKGVWSFFHTWDFNLEFFCKSFNTYYSKISSCAYTTLYFCFHVLESDGVVHVVCMVRCMGENFFRWPDREDLLDYTMDDILCTISPPEPSGQFHRGSPVLFLPEMFWKKLMLNCQRKT